MEMFGLYSVANLGLTTEMIGDKHYTATTPTKNVFVYQTLVMF